MLLALLTLVSNKTGILWPGCSHFSPAYYISSFLRELAGMCWSSPTEPCSHSESPIKTFVIEVGRSRYELDTSYSEKGRGCMQFKQVKMYISIKKQS